MIFFSFFSPFFRHTQGIWKSLGQELNLSQSYYLCHCCSNAGYLTPCTRPGIELAPRQRQAGSLIHCATVRTPGMIFNIKKDGQGIEHNSFTSSPAVGIRLFYFEAIVNTYCFVSSVAEDTSCIYLPRIVDFSKIVKWLFIDNALSLHFCNLTQLAEKKKIHNLKVES